MLQGVVDGTEDRSIVVAVGIRRGASTPAAMPLRRFDAELLLLLDGLGFSSDDARARAAAGTMVVVVVVTAAAAAAAVVIVGKRREVTAVLNGYDVVWVLPAMGASILMMVSMLVMLLMMLRVYLLLSLTKGVTLTMLVSPLRWHRRLQLPSLLLKLELQHPVMIVQLGEPLSSFELSKVPAVLFTSRLVLVGLRSISGDQRPVLLTLAMVLARIDERESFAAGLVPVFGTAFLDFDAANQERQREAHRHVQQSMGGWLTKTAWQGQVQYISGSLWDQRMWGVEYSKGLRV